jgi:DNA repair protein RadD
MELVQVASVATLFVRGVKSDAMRMPPADLIVIDEAHHSPANSYQKIVEAYPDAKILGLTATPCRGDGRGLGGIFTEIVEAPQVAQLIERGCLVKTRVYAPVDPNLKGVDTQNGDYVTSQLSERVNTDQLVGDIVTQWHKHGERRKTVAFAVDVAHSMHIRDEFVRARVRAEHIEGKTPKEERDEILGRLRSGDLELVSNCMVLTEGWDMPDVSCCILARPTKKMGLYRQMLGRVLRAATDKVDAVVLDHSGAVFRHGLAEDPVEWVLDPDRKAVSKVHESRKRESGLIECTECSALRLGGQPCPACGFMPRRPSRGVDYVDGDLALVGAARPDTCRSSNVDPSTASSAHTPLSAATSLDGRRTSSRRSLGHSRRGTGTGFRTRHLSRRRGRGSGRGKLPSPSRGQPHEPPPQGQQRGATRSPLPLHAPQPGVAKPYSQRTLHLSGDGRPVWRSRLEQRPHTLCVPRGEGVTQHRADNSDPRNMGTGRSGLHRRGEEGSFLPQEKARDRMAADRVSLRRDEHPDRLEGVHAMAASAAKNSERGSCGETVGSCSETARVLW